jgi:integrase/recombinase XerC
MKKKRSVNNDGLHLDQFAQYLEEQDRSPQTVRGYNNDLQLFSQWFLKNNGEHATIQIITPTDIREYRQYLLVVERRKANTINRRLAAISALMQWAKTTHRIESNPAEQIKSVQNLGSGPHYLDRKEQYALNRAIERDLQLSRIRYPKRWVVRLRDASLVRFMLHTGVRLGEALDMCIEDVDLGDKKGHVVVQNGKGGKQRTIPLNSEARKSLRAWFGIRPESKSRHIWIVVEGQHHERLGSRSVQRVIRRIGQDAGLPGLTAHMLRHTFAKNLVDSGVGLEKVAALLGHSNLNTTRIYITPSHKDLEDAVEAAIMQ